MIIVVMRIELFHQPINAVDSLSQLFAEQFPGYWHHLEYAYVFALGNEALNYAWRFKYFWEQ